MTDDPDPMVRMQLAYSLGETVGEDGVTGLARLAQQSAQAPYLRAAIISSLNRDNLIRFHNTLANHPEIADLYQPTMLEMASRMNNVPFLTAVANDLLEQIESVTPSPDNMHALAEITVIERQGNQLPKPTQDRIGSSLKHALNLAMDRKMIRRFDCHTTNFRNDQHSERRWICCPSPNPLTDCCNPGDHDQSSGQDTGSFFIVESQRQGCSDRKSVAARVNDQ